MNRSSAKKLLSRQIIGNNSRIPKVSRSSCHVFINHREIDTKRTVAGLLYHYLTGLRLHPYLDNKSMNIDSAIKSCKVGISVFSPHFCESYHCLDELALIMEMKKKVIPIFCDIKPSELQVVNNGSCPEKELQRFRWALHEAKNTVGLTFDSSNGNWTELITSTSEIVVKSLKEIEEDRGDPQINAPILI